MARKPEQRLWDRMRAALDPKMVHLERVENLVGSGMPDVLAVSGGVVTWCELKAVDAPPARVTTPLLGASKGLNQEQANWHLTWQAHGGRSCVIIGCSSSVYMLPAEHVQTTNSRTLGEMPEIDWAGVQFYLRGK